MYSSTTLDIQPIKKSAGTVRLAFLIETKLNRDLLHRILNEYFKNVDYILGYAYNHASLYGSFPDVLDFYRKKYKHTFFLFETNTFDKEVIKEQIAYFNEDFKEYELEDYVTFIPIYPHFQAWIRPKMKEYIEDKHDFELFGIDPNAIPIDFEQMKKEVPEFKKLVKQIEAFANKKEKKKPTENGQKH